MMPNEAAHDRHVQQMALIALIKEIGGEVRISTSRLNAAEGLTLHVSRNPLNPDEYVLRVR